MFKNTREIRAKNSDLCAQPSTRPQHHTLGYATQLATWVLKDLSSAHPSVPVQYIKRAHSHCVCPRSSELCSAQCKTLEPYFGDAPWLAMWVLRIRIPSKQLQYPGTIHQGSTLANLIGLRGAEPCPIQCSAQALSIELLREKHGFGKALLRDLPPLRGAPVSQRRE